MTRSFIGIGILLCIWYCASATGLVHRVFLPSPIAVSRELLRLTSSGEILYDVTVTTLRTLSGCVVGASGGIVIGLLLGRFQLLRDLFDLPIDFCRSIPATALFPLFIVVFGLGFRIQMFVAAWASAMVMIVSAAYGMRSVSPVRLQLARLRRLSAFRVFTVVMLPGSLRFIVAGIRVAISLALVVELVAEMFLGSNSGLGHRLFNATSVFAMEEAYASIVMVGLLGYTLNQLVQWCEKRIIHWPPTE